MRRCIIICYHCGFWPPICGRLDHIEYLSHSRSRQTCSATERAKAGPIRGVGADVLRHDRQVAGLGAIAPGLVDSTFRSASISHSWPSAFGADRSHQTGKNLSARSAIVETGLG